MMTSFMIVAGEEGNATAPKTEADAEDENEAYSPSRSFTPPPSDSIPFIGVSSDPTTTVLSAIPSDISLPSNLSEILASIKKRESDGTPLTANSGKGINLKEDPIVQNYTSESSPGDQEPAKVENDEASYVPQDDDASSPTTSFNSYTPPSSSQPASAVVLLNTAASSVVPALLSLSTPVVHPPTTKSEGSARDPRQKQTETPKPASTLSSLSDDDLIKKAMEMEAEEKSAMLSSTLQQPLPPGVDNFPVPSATAPLPPLPVKQAPAPLKILPLGQPLPPGLEDEEYTTYSSPFPPPPPPPPLQGAAPPLGLQPLGPPPPQNVNFPRHPNPVGYHIPPPTHFNSPPPPPPSYNMGPPAHVSSPQGSNFNASFPPAPPVLYSKSPNTVDEPPPMLRNKRKFQDVDNDMNPEKRDQGREPWDKKVPVPVRGRYNPRPNMRGGGGRYGNRRHHQQRGFMRPRGRNGPPHRMRWSQHGSDEDKSRYDANIRSEWDSHIKEFEEKRTRDKLRDRDRDRPSSSRSYGRSNKNRSSDKGNDDAT